MSNEKLKPCPICESKCFNATTTTIGNPANDSIDCRDCNFTTYRRYWNNLPRTETPTNLQQMWMELAPEFDEEKYEYVIQRTPAKDVEVWNPFRAKWEASSGMSEFALLRRPKKPVWKFEEITNANLGLVGNIRVHRNGTHQQTIKREVYDAITAAYTSKTTT